MCCKLSTKVELISTRFGICAPVGEARLASHANAVNRSDEHGREMDVGERRVPERSKTVSSRVLTLEVSRVSKWWSEMEEMSQVFASQTIEVLAEVTYLTKRERVAYNIGSDQ